MSGIRRRSVRPVARRAIALVVVALVVVFAGCEATVAVGVEVQPDASGTVQVSLGLDADASQRAGDLDELLRLDDLEAAGWSKLPPPEAGQAVEDRSTWVALSKPFADPTQFSDVMAELNPDVFRDFELVEESSTLGTTYSVTGTIDLTGGLRSFSDPELDAVEGDPLGSQIASTEAELGRPVTDMVEISLAVRLPGMSSDSVVTPSFGDVEPTVVDVSSTEGNWLRSALVWIVVGVVVLAVLIAARVVQVHRRRARRAAARRAYAGRR